MYLFTILQNIGMKKLKDDLIYKRKEIMRTIFILTKVYQTLRVDTMLRKRIELANFRKNYEYTYESISKVI